MKILLHNPDNGITGNFMPHLWMFLLQARTQSPAFSEPADRRQAPRDNRCASGENL
jgi:hypothetical protein